MHCDYCSAAGFWTIMNLHEFSFYIHWFDDSESVLTVSACLFCFWQSRMRYDRHVWVVLWRGLGATASHRKVCIPAGSIESACSVLCALHNTSMPMWSNIGNMIFTGTVIKIVICRPLDWPPRCLPNCKCHCRYASWRVSWRVAGLLYRANTSWNLKKMN